MNNSEKRILVCSPLPSENSGASLVIFYQYLKYLKQQNVSILYIACFKPTTSDQQRYQDFCRQFSSEQFQIMPWPAEQYFTVKKSRALNAISFLNIPDAIKNKIAQFKPDILLALDFTAAALFKNIIAKQKIVILGDLIYQTSWYHNLYAVKEGKIARYKLIYFWLMSLYWAYLYRSTLKKFTTVIVLAKKCEKDLLRLGIHSKYQPYPWHTDLQCTEQNKRNAIKIPTFLVYGGLEALGSRAALHLLLDKIYPRLVKEWGQHGFIIHMCGAGVLPKWAQNKITQLPEIKHHGFVDDLSGLMSQCHAVLAPIDVPVGNRTRIVNAMKLKTLIIAHKNTALGNPDLVHKQTCLLATDEHDFFMQMKRAVEDSTLADEIILRAEAVYNEKFSPPNAVKPLLELLES